MRDIFAQHGQPFFNQADLLMIGPLDGPAVLEIVNAGFRTTDRNRARPPAGSSR